MIKDKNVNNNASDDDDDFEKADKEIATFRDERHL